MVFSIPENLHPELMPLAWLIGTWRGQGRCEYPIIEGFDIDIENDLGCVVFDEIHFINDEKRGTNWEQTIMMMPSHIQIIGLSATLDHPENFAQWLENTLNKSSVENSVELNSLKKEVYLCRKLIRSVPLIHYSFIISVSAVNKIIKDKTIQQEIHFAKEQMRK
jgi:superfamily II RNA helicase